MELALSDEKRLIKHLTDHYEHVGVVGRPVENTSGTVHVELAMNLLQIFDVDIKSQVLNAKFRSDIVSMLQSSQCLLSQSSL